VAVSRRNGDRRRFRRFRYDARADIGNAEGGWSCRVLDLSLKGVLLERPLLWTGEAGDRFSMALAVGGLISISMEITVAWQTEEQIGCYWHAIDDESFTQLKRLAAMHLGSRRLLSRELNALRR
jgi:hypothetical protein